MDDSPRSALNLRLVLACFGAVVCVVLGVLALRVSTSAGVVLLGLACVAVVDGVVVQRRRRRRALAHRGADHRHDSLFE